MRINFPLHFGSKSISHYNRIRLGHKESKFCLFISTKMKSTKRLFFLFFFFSFLFLAFCTRDAITHTQGREGIRAVLQEISNLSVCTRATHSHNNDNYNKKRSVCRILRRSELFRRNLFSRHEDCAKFALFRAQPTRNANQNLQWGAEHLLYLSF